MAISREQLNQIMSGFQPCCVIGAGAELGIFTTLGRKTMTAQALAQELACDGGALTILLDALTAMRFLRKKGEFYSVPSNLRPLLSEQSRNNMLPGIWHRMNVLRAWAQLGKVVKKGKPAEDKGSIRGIESDRAAFIGAMHTGSGPVADQLIKRLGRIRFNHLLDVGGASGTWTLAFLRAFRKTKATLFDLPDAIEQARIRIRKSGYLERVTLVPGDFYSDDLPKGADFAWVSAIIHQHSRAQNRKLFEKVYTALEPGGLIAIRDMVMNSSRTRPLAGAMFAINMLVNTKSGGTYTFKEIAEDLKATGFASPKLAIWSEDMSSVVTARKSTTKFALSSGMLDTLSRGPLSCAPKFPGVPYK